MSTYAERVSPKKAALFLGVSIRTLEEWRKRKIGPAFVKLGPKLVRYEIAELERFLASSR
ncbi:helix-turn-helix transcriptional regulator [Lysobacter sp. A3-1-A15]|uniref:helix-turn-helix transcriptional regulator n=1 Tax=Novilysobacter viscosus TaxID=3098602 RepID=UPI003983D6CD